jgi:diadenosine tetraphosphate (Ap4A) HIT family hydrolase
VLSIPSDLPRRDRLSLKEGEHMTFVLHLRLAADTVHIADWSLSRVQLMNDKRYPWIVLVPRRAEIIELFDLDEAARATLMSEIAYAGAKLKAWTKARGGCDKINVGMIGNIVPQLHVHIVARTKTDAVWPAPVWGKGEPIPYAAVELERIVASLRA